MLHYAKVTHVQVAYVRCVWIKPSQYFIKISSSPLNKSNSTTFTTSAARLLLAFYFHFVNALHTATAVDGRTVVV